MNKRIRKKKGLKKVTAEECWSLDFTLAKYILPRLIKYKEINTMSYPSSFENVEEWHKVVDKMIWSFEKVVKDNTRSDYSVDIDAIKEENKRFLEGMHLFAEHFRDLWD